MNFITAPERDRKTMFKLPSPLPASLSPGRQTAIALLACGGLSLLALPLAGRLDEANIVMVYLLVVLVLAATVGRPAGIAAAFFSVAAFDFCFVPPRFSMSVSDGQYLITFAVMLAVALVTAHLAAGLRREAENAARRERQTRALYEMARELAGALTTDQVDAICRTTLEQHFAASGRLLLADGDTLLQAETLDPAMRQLAVTAFTSGQMMAWTNSCGRPEKTAYFPLRAPMRRRGILLATCADEAGGADDERLHLLGAVASLAAIAVERLHYVEVAQRSELEMQGERLRSSVLSALSHDLRTPLTALVGLADSLFLLRPALPQTALETATAMQEQATRLSGMVANLLDMARLQSGQLTLRREWQSLEEIVGAAIKLLGSALDRHPVRVALPADLPLLEFDAVLIERVLGNLLENAAKYAPPDSPIDISAHLGQNQAEIRVEDRGPGFAGASERYFAAFVRGEDVEAGGSGLGLAICRSIVEAHGGRIGGGPREGGGASLWFTLPAGQPPAIEAEDA